MRARVVRRVRLVMPAMAPMASRPPAMPMAIVSHFVAGLAGAVGVVSGCVFAGDRSMTGRVGNPSVSAGRTSCVRWAAAAALAAAGGVSAGRARAVGAASAAIAIAVVMVRMLRGMAVLLCGGWVPVS